MFSPAVMVAVCRWRGYLAKCWGGWTKEALTDWGPMLRLGSAGTISLMGEWWSWEMASGMAAVLGPIQLAAHAGTVATTHHPHAAALPAGCARRPDHGTVAISLAKKVTV